MFAFVQCRALPVHVDSVCRLKLAVESGILVHTAFFVGRVTRVRS